MLLRTPLKLSALDEGIWGSSSLQFLENFRYYTEGANGLKAHLSLPAPSHFLNNQCAASLFENGVPSVTGFILSSSGAQLTSWKRTVHCERGTFSL